MSNRAGLQFGILTVREHIHQAADLQKTRQWTGAGHYDYVEGDGRMKARCILTKDWSPTWSLVGRRAALFADELLA